MNGYGQQTITPEQFAQALKAVDHFQQQAQRTQGIARTGNPFMMLGDALRTTVQNKFGQHKDADFVDASEQVRMFNEQSKAAIQAAKDKKAQAAAEAALQKKIETLAPQYGENAKAIAMGLIKPSDLKPDLTTLQKNAAAAGYDINTPQGQQFIKAQMSKSNAPIVNVGTGDNAKYKTGPVDKGYYQRINPETGEPELVKMKGGAPEENTRKEQSAIRSKADMELAAFNDLNPVIDRAVDQIGPWTTGFAGAQFSKVEGTEAHNLAKNLETIQSDQALGRLVKLKESGGTLGAVSEKELGLLMSAKRNLEQSQSDEQLLQNMREYQTIRKQSMQRLAEAYREDFGEYPPGYEQPQEKQSGNVQKLANDYTLEQLMQMKAQMSKQ